MVAIVVWTPRAAWARDKAFRAVTGPPVRGERSGMAWRTLTLSTRGTGDQPASPWFQSLNYVAGSAVSTNSRSSAQIQGFLVTLTLRCIRILSWRIAINIFTSELGQCRPFDRVRRSANIDIVGIVPHCSRNASIGRSRRSLW